MARATVRTHKRKTRSGGTTTVRTHTRGFRPSAGHSLHLARRSYTAGRRKHRVAATIFGVAALAELGLWITLGGTALLATLVGTVLLAIAVIITGRIPTDRGGSGA